MRFRDRKKGMTLVEIIVSIAILGIIAVAFLPVFTTGFSSVFHAGNKSEALYRAQQDMEGLIADKTITASPPVENTDKMTITKTVSINSVTINAAGGIALANPTIQGRNLQVEAVYNSANKKATLKAFMSND